MDQSYSVTPAPAHPDEGRLLREAVLLGEVCVPGVPLLAGVGRDERDVETSPEQLDFSLRFVVPVAASPGPWLAGRRLFRDLRRCTCGWPVAGGFTPKRSSSCRLNGLMVRVLIVHHKVVTVEPFVPRGFLAGESRGVVCRSWVLIPPGPIVQMAIANMRKTFPAACR